MKPLRQIIRCHWVSHRDKLLGSGRMNTYCGVELRLGGTALQRDAEALHYFAGVRTNHMTSDNTIRSTVHNQLHHCLLSGTSQRIF